DSGTGISKEVIPHIFDPFFTTKSQGQGLGLSTSHSIISKHGGDISVESEKGKGTTFTIYLPAATRDPCSKDRPKDSEKKKTKRNTFLIMEDEFVVQKVMKSMLESLGYTVLTTQQGQEAIDLFKKEKKQGNTIDGMLFDLTIPGGMGGREAVSGIRKIDKEIPVFVASGYTSDDIMANPEKYGFTASIKKPFKISELSEMLSRYL
ncbi:MAG: ATP-binding protein, partial [Chitinivibrionales bacterium]